MAKQEPSPGSLLSKMAQFVRSQGTQWNDLDRPGPLKGASVSKQALQDMIERKRQNDQTRKREFDMLRKQLRREATAVPSGGAARASFFNSSLPSRPDDRVMTLKKINDIEEQMAVQWGKTKHGTTPQGLGAPTRTQIPPALGNARLPGQSPAGASGSGAAAGRIIAPRPNPVMPGNASAHAPTVPSPIPGRASSKPPGAQAFAPTEVPRQSAAKPPFPGRSTIPNEQADDMSLDFTAQESPAASEPSQTTPPLSSPPNIPIEPAKADPAPAQNLPMRTDLLRAGLPTSKFFALEVKDVLHDPELEEASIRFAIGDDTGAVAGLLEAIGDKGTRHDHEETWLALFDLYRATGVQDRFDDIALEFASKFGRSAPTWFSMPELVAKLPSSQPASPEVAGKIDWKCPAAFGIQSLATLKAALAKAPMPWTLDWSALRSIDADVVVPLTELFLSWAAQPLQLRFESAAQLEEVLRLATPSGVQTANQSGWILLMAFLRIAHRPDDFDLAALDFCVTYEVSPPSWESARCEVQLLDSESAFGVRQTIIGDTVRDSITSQWQTDPDGATTAMSAQLAAVELSGQITGEPKSVLEKLEARLMGADVLIISCAKLIRVDFAAAGSLLNWVTDRQSEGRLVHFTDVHRLLLGFFNVIGISEHAKVVLRAD